MVRIVSSLIVLAILAGAAYYALTPAKTVNTPVATATPPTGKAVTSPTAPAKLAPSAVLSIDPRASTVASNARPTVASAVAVSPAVAEFLERKAWPQLYERIKSQPPTAESLYLQLAMLEACATISDRNDPRRQRPPIEARRQRFEASLPANGPDNALRKTAFEKMSADFCGDLSKITVTEADLTQLREQAVQAGSMAARMRTLTDEVWKEAEAAPPPPNGPREAAPTLTEAQERTLREALASKDPFAIRAAGELLSNTLRDASVSLGTDGQPIDNMAFHMATNIVACDFGLRCDSDTHYQLLSACAHQGRCAASSYADYVNYYGASPHQAQLVESYRQQLAQMIASGNLDALRVRRGPQPETGNRFTFRSR